MKIIIDNLCKSFFNKNVLKHFSKEFYSGKIYVLRGPSGSGKSTILNLIAKFDENYSGDILIDGVNLKNKSKKTLYRKELGYLFQNYALLEDETVFNNLKLGIQERMTPKNIKDTMISALKQVNLDESYLSKHVYELSGGEQQRVAIARLVLKRPKIILIDEPTAALDEANSIDILNNVLDKMISEETIMIVASHDQFVFDWADEIVDIV